MSSSQVRVASVSIHVCNTLSTVIRSQCEYIVATYSREAEVADIGSTLRGPLMAIIINMVAVIITEIMTKTTRKNRSTILAISIHSSPLPCWCSQPQDHIDFVVELPPCLLVDLATPADASDWLANESTGDGDVRSTSDLSPFMQSILPMTSRTTRRRTRGMGLWCPWCMYRTPTVQNIENPARSIAPYT